MEFTVSSISVSILIFALIATNSGIVADVDKETLRRLENAHELIHDEINTIKQKVWIELTSNVETLQHQMSAVRQDIQLINQEQKSRLAEDNSDNLKQCVTIADRDKSYTGMLARALGQEKQFTRGLQRKIANMQKTINGLLEENVKILATQNDIKDLVNQNDGEIDTINTEINAIKELVNHNDGEIDTINIEINDIKTERKQAESDLEWLNSYKNEVTRSRSIKRPSFISDWFLMKSQDPELSEITIEHGLGVIPAKVDVLVKAIDGPNSGWIFHGDTAFQGDDDVNAAYGGVVYLYNEKHVRLWAPKKNNNYASGRIINTGSQDSMRLGKYHQMSEKALVKVKVWAPTDMPSPDFNTTWLPLNITDSKFSYNEIEHNLGDYPAIINVQVYNRDTNLISEGVGASVICRPWINGGGTVWAFDSKTIRIWSAFRPNPQEGGIICNKPVGAGDGWGKKYLTSLESNTAEVKILAWSQNTVELNQNFFVGKAETDMFQFGPVTSLYRIRDEDLLTMFIEASSGKNKGFRFKGYGSSQGKHVSFGGGVFAYNGNGEFRAWPPNPANGGHLIHISLPYGNGKNVQVSDEAMVVYSLLKTWP